MDDIDNIYSAANIARSRERAAAIRQMVAAGTLEAEGWLEAADGIDEEALAREAHALAGAH